MPSTDPHVKAASQAFIGRVDHYVGGAKLDSLPNTAHRQACDDLVGKRSPTIRTALAWFVFYALENPDWGFDSLPPNYRREPGNKWTCEELTRRGITLHGPVVAFFENNIGKGARGNFRFPGDARFQDFVAAVRDALGDRPELRRIADYLAERFADSNRDISPLPNVADDLLTFARAKALFYLLIDTPSEGYIQQFLVAALLTAFRRRAGVEVRTHNPHASDASDDAAGDIEEFADGRRLKAYEVTARPDWKNRLSGSRAKMDSYGLSKYVIIAANVNTDDELNVPARLAMKLAPYHRDIAAIDIKDVANFFAAELSPAELRESVNLTHRMLTTKTLCGKAKIIDSYAAVVSGWLDAAPGPLGEVPPDGGHV